MLGRGVDILESYRQLRVTSPLAESYDVNQLPRSPSPVRHRSPTLGESLSFWSLCLRYVLDVQSGVSLGATVPVKPGSVLKPVLIVTDYQVSF